jgi:hypothetical protein
VPFDYIEIFYNRERAQAGLGHLSPLDYEASLERRVLVLRESSTKSDATLRRFSFWNLDLTFRPFPTDQEDDAETDQTPQHHENYPSEDWARSLGDRLHLFNRYKSSFNLRQHSLSRANKVLGIRKPRFNFTHVLTPLFSRLESSQPF